MTKTAILDESRKYRYELTRSIAVPLVVEAPRVSPVTFIMLNPSTADESANDATISKCMRFSARWGFHEMIVVNLFAYRSTDPDVLKEVEDPVGANNDNFILAAARRSQLVVCAWGRPGKVRGRGQAVQELLRQDMHFPKCLGTNQDGTPKHPLYLPGDTELEPFGWSVG